MINIRTRREDATDHVKKVLSVLSSKEYLKFLEYSRESSTKPELSHIAQFVHFMFSLFFHLWSDNYYEVCTACVALILLLDVLLPVLSLALFFGDQVCGVFCNVVIKSVNY